LNSYCTSSIFCASGLLLATVVFDRERRRVTPQSTSLSAGTACHGHEFRQERLDVVAVEDEVLQDDRGDRALVLVIVSQPSNFRINPPPGTRDAGEEIVGAACC
jgi:hypothetical protein